MCWPDPAGRQHHLLLNRGGGQLRPRRRHRRICLPGAGGDHRRVHQLAHQASTPGLHELPQATMQRIARHWLTDFHGVTPRQTPICPSRNRASKSVTAPSAAGCCGPPGSPRSCSPPSTANWERWPWCPPARGGVSHPGGRVLVGTGWPTRASRGQGDQQRVRDVIAPGGISAMRIANPQPSRRHHP